MNRLIRTASELAGVSVALIVAVSAFFHDVGFVTAAVRAAVAGVGVTALARVVGWSVSSMLMNSSTESSVLGPDPTHDAIPVAGTPPGRE